MRVPPLPPLLIALLLRGAPARGDNYMNHPRGSNNKLNEQNNNVQNNKRLFDSQNNDAAGYQVGDNCVPNCLNDATYDPAKPGAGKGIMQFYQGSELYIEWIQQHGCGMPRTGQNNLECQMILQYMCQSESPTMRDGNLTGNNNVGSAGGDGNKVLAPDDDPTQGPRRDLAAEPDRGMQETFDYYNRCRRRERNKGLFVADRTKRMTRTNCGNNVACDAIGATVTRQNSGENENPATDRHGLECPEERDYYPYWHPTPWRDIAVITSEPKRCGYYQEESQNVKGRGYCVDPANSDPDDPEKAATAANNPAACAAGGGAWREKAGWGIAPPDCRGAQWTRDNHNGNAKDGLPFHYTWTIPSDAFGTCIVRTRYNISTGDLDGVKTVLGAGVDPFFVDKSFNDRELPSMQGKLSLTNDPKKVDWVGAGVGVSGPLQLQINTDQYGRTFQDRSHVFEVLPNPNLGRVVNFNVRGRRGNIVQVYPSVEYDFVPPEVEVQEGDYIHFQWTGSDANQQNNDGNGRRGTDRSNLAQVPARDQTAPMRHTDVTLFTKDVAVKFAWLEQNNDSCSFNNPNDNSDDNCGQLNAAPAYFNHPPMQMNQVGVYHVTSTRNNDFSNRSQRTTITVRERLANIVGAILVAVVVAFHVGVALYLAAAYYAWRHPGSWLFGIGARPRVLYLMFDDNAIAEKEAQRRALQDARAQPDGFERDLSSASLEAPLARVSSPSQSPGSPSAAHVYSEQDGDSPRRANRKAACCGRCLGWCGSHEAPPIACFFLVNAVLALWGYASNAGGGYQQSIYFPLAKAFGYALDFNLAIVVLPTLRSLQAMLRNMVGLDNVVPFVDDPIFFHQIVGSLIVALSILHTYFHFHHMAEINDGFCCLGPFLLPTDDTRGGTPVVDLIFDPNLRYAPFTGLVLLLAFLLFAITAHPRIRRRALGGFNVFMNIHRTWPLMYLILVFHAPQILIWMLFPFMIIVTDHVVQYRRRHTRVHLRRATLLERDVVRLEFEIPRGFTYQAGQYMLINFHEVSLKGWHPFTISTCPEDPYITAHVRSPDAYDWCSRMRRRVIDASLHCVDPDRPDGPAPVHVQAYASSRPSDAEKGGCPAIERWRGSAPGAGKDLGVRMQGLRVVDVVKDGPAHTAGVKKGMTLVRLDGTTVRSPHEVPGLWRGAEGTFRADFKEFPPPRAGTTVEFSAGRHPRNGKLHCDPSAVQYPSGRRVGGSKEVMAVPTPPVVGELDRQYDHLLPGVQAFIDGPYGAPSERVWAFDVVMLVGTGIGVTPFASIIRQMNLRSAQCRRIDDTGAKGLELVRQSLARGLPRHVYFYWICRSTSEFEWFHDLLEDAMRASSTDDRDRVRIVVFWTETGEVSKIRRVPWLLPPHRQFHGRPKWASLFREVRDAHRGEKVGVFLCGPPAVEKELRKEGKAHTQRPSEGGTSFVVCSENF